MFTKELVEKIVGQKLHTVTTNLSKIDELVGEEITPRQDDILIVKNDGSFYLTNINHFVNTFCIDWAYEQGYYLTINHAPAITMIYPKEVDTQQHKEFSKGSTIPEAMVNLINWILKNKG